MATKVSKKSVEKIKEALKVVEDQQAEDRSAYNCTNCNGEGHAGTDRLKNPLICQVCRGTGKV